MNRLQNITKGARREKGPCQRELPVTADGLNRIYDKVDWGCPDSVAIWCAISIAWFFMLRMGEYIAKKSLKEQSSDNDTRHPLQMDEIEPLINGKRSDWPDGIDEIAIYISGSKTDWLNQGIVRSDNRIPEGTTNSHLCPLRSLVKLRKLRPAKFRRTPTEYSLPVDRANQLNPTVCKHCYEWQYLNRECAYCVSPPLPACRGATALYRATGNIELVARMGRWGTSSISAYLLESHEIMRGLGKLMAQGSHTLRHATRDLIALMPN